MAGRGRGRGRGRGAAESSGVGAGTTQPNPVPSHVENVSQPSTAGAVPTRGRGRGRGAPSAAAAAAPEIVNPVPTQTEQVPESSRPRGGGAVPRRNGGEGGMGDGNGLADKMSGLDLTRNRNGDGGDNPKRERRMRAHEEENLSSGHFNDFRINVKSIDDQSTGAKLPLVANAIGLYPPNLADQPFAIQYQVEFNPHLESKKLRIALIRSNEEKFGGKNFLYDGGSTLYTSKVLGDGQPLEFNVKTRREEDITIRVIHRSNVYINGHGGESLRIAAVLLKKGLSNLNYMPFDRHHFDPQSKIDMKNGYELWPGYSTSVNSYEGGMLLVADTQFKLASVKTVYQEMTELFRASKGDLSIFQKQATDKFVGRTVFTPYNQKRHRIDDINFEANPMTEFERRGERVTFKAYYEQAYGLQINDEKQPLLVSQPKESDRRRGMTQAILLVPELAYITGISDEQRNNHSFTRAMGTVTKQDPTVRSKCLKDLVDRFTNDPETQSNFAYWNMRFDPQLFAIEGRQIRPPKIRFRDPVDYNTNSADFGSCLRNCKFGTAISVSHYAIFFTQQTESVAQDLSSKIVQVGQQFGMSFGELTAVKVPSLRTEDFVRSLTDTQMRLNGKLKLCIFVLNDARADRYNAIKKICVAEQPVPSQCILANTLKNPKGVMSVVSKLVLQMNAKLGGEPWMTDFRIPGMQVMGMDVYHQGKTKRKSTVGFVASLNDSFTRFHSRAFVNNQEEVHVLETAVTSALTKYKEFNKQWPKYLVMFRDGVGEGQLLKVQSTEVNAFKNVLETLQCPAKLCFVVVSKRIMQRFFLRNRDNSLGNPGPGTVVFNGLTKPNRFDFFLSPISSRQGTVTPTHYNVLSDNTPFSQDHGKLMQLAFHQCFMYYNWTGAIRVPAVCQYAHKLAYLVGENMSSTEPSSQLAETLFYL